MTILASDDFAGSGALNASNWTQTTFAGSGNPTRVSGQLSCPTGVAGFMRWTALSWPNDQKARLTYITPGSDAVDNGSGPAVRIATGGAVSGYLLQVGNGDTRLYKFNAASPTQLGSTLAGAPSNGDVYVLSITGTTITATKNGSNICGTPLTDATFASGQAGFWFAADTAADLRDNWDGADSGGFGGGGGQVNSRGGIALSSISALNGIAKASISAVNGLTI